MISKNSQEGRKVSAYILVKNNVRAWVIASDSSGRSLTLANELFDSLCRCSDPLQDVVRLYSYSDGNHRPVVVKHWGGHPSWSENIKLGY